MYRKGRIMMGIKDVLGYRNDKKRVLARLGNSKSIVEVFDGITNNNEARYKFAVALTDANGTAVTDMGVILTGDELTELAAAINKLAERGEIHPLRTRAEHQALYPEKERKQIPLFF